MDLKFKVGDRVRTLTSVDYGGHKLFSIGTEGKIAEINDNKESKLPYRVQTEDGSYWYNDSMIELVEEVDKTKFFVNKLKVFKLVGEVIKKTEGDDELLKDIVYYIECYRKREHLK